MSENNIFVEVAGLTALRKAMIVLGIVLVLFGVGLLLIVASTVYQAFQSPGDVAFVQYLTTLAEFHGPIIKGTMTMQTQYGPQQTAFEFMMSPKVKSLLFLVFGLMAMVLMIMISRGVIDGGVSIIKGALYSEVRRQA